MGKFGKTVDRLFSTGRAVTLSELCQASKLDQAFREARKNKFQLDSFKIEVKRGNEPIDLDALTKPVPYSGRLEKELESQRRDKFKLPNGLELETTAPKVSESKAESKPRYFESIGNQARGKVEVSFTTQGGIRW